MEADKIILILLIVFALFSVFAENLKHAVMGVSVFGLWMSFAYLFYHAPDVAIAEAVIASSLGTILYIITIKNYNDITVRPTKQWVIKAISSYVIISISCLIVLYLTSKTVVVGDAALYNLVMEYSEIKGGQVNPVANIYLNYRIFDTIFEALMLLISGIGVIHLIKQGGGASHE